MGKQKWIEQLAGQTAVAVQMFKTTGTEMSSAFGSIGANATSMGVGMAEQIAILGQLQATMTGSEAGTKFKAFLSGAGKAQKALGLSFTDSQGKILPMVDILEKIKGKFGDIDTVAKSDLFQKAFGRKEAVDLIKLLLQNTDGLATNIDTIGKQTGMTRAMEMATAMLDPVERLSQGGKAVRVAFGQILMRALEPFINAMADGAGGMLRWINLFPNLTRWLGVGLLALTGLVVTIGLFSVAVGIGRFMMIGWGIAVNIAKGILFLFKLGLMAARGAMFLFQIAVYLGSGALKALRLGFLSLVPGVWAFTAALLANPITWIVLGVVALIAAVVGLVLYWDQLVVLFSDNAWAQALLAPIYLIIDGFKFLIDHFDLVGSAWAGFVALFAAANPFALLGSAADWIISKLNLIPGIEISTASTGPQNPEAPVLASRQASGAALPPGGGVTNKISNAVSNSGKTINIEKIEVVNGGQVDGAMLANELAMAT